MVYAIISDIHANLIALSATLKDAQQCGANKVLCLGDVVGYGPEPEAVVNKIRNSISIVLAGNHDDAVSGRLHVSDFIDIAADAVIRHREALSEENIHWLRNLPYVYKGKSFYCVHGDFTSPRTFEYVSNESEAEANFSVTNSQLMFVGHSHVPGIFLTGRSGRVYSLPPTDFTLEEGKRYIVNPGSVGYPRTDGNICETTYVLYDDVERSIIFRHIPFSVRSVMQTGRNPKRMKKRVIALITSIVAIMAGVFAWMLAPKERVETITEIVTNNVTRVVERKVTEVIAVPKVDHSKNLILPSSAKKVRIKVKIAKKFPAAQLQLTFKDKLGKMLWEERWTVKKSKNIAMKIPTGATIATLSAVRVNGNTPLKFDAFALSIEQ
jgi:predicted phosphodiesterase